MPVYTVRAGDTLARIAKKFSVAMDTIVRLNNLKNPDKLRAGMDLQIPDVTTDAMDAPAPLAPAPPAPPEGPAEIAIDRRTLILPSKEYLPEVVNKDLVVLHFTAGASARSAFTTWLNNPERVATAYIVDPDGTVYEVFDPTQWAFHLGIKGSRGVHDRRSVGIEIANVGPLKPSPEDPDRLNWWPNNWGSPWCRREETAKYVHASFRGIDDFAAFPDPQVDAVARLVRHLCDRFSIPKTIPPGSRRSECDVAFFGSFKGVATHQNFRRDKWDIGPAFPWERLGL
jgi:N-acetyl-anhydromuramyl-L-alanine amidase AmpD